MQQLSPLHTGADGDDNAYAGQGLSQHVVQGMPCAPHAANPPPLHVPGEQRMPALPPDDGGCSADSSDVERDQPEIESQPAPGEALPAEEDEFLEELQPFEAAASGDNSSSSVREEEEEDETEDDDSAW